MASSVLVLREVITDGSRCRGNDGSPSLLGLDTGLVANVSDYPTSSDTAETVLAVGAWY
jgi:hypothetical protein